MNWLILIPCGIALIALIIYLVIRNNKDEKEFEKELIIDDTIIEEKEEDTEVEDES